MSLRSLKLAFVAMAVSTAASATPVASPFGRADDAAAPPRMIVLAQAGEGRVSVGSGVLGASAAIASLPASAGPVLQVREQRSGRNFIQRIVLGGGLVGENGIDIEIGSVSRPSISGIKAELSRRFPGVAMDPISGRTLQNPYGVFSVAIGAPAGGGRCLYAWQSVSDLRRLSGRSGGGGGLIGGSADADIRVKLCRKNMDLDQLAGLVEQLVIGAPSGLDRVWGTDPALAAAMASTPGAEPRAAVPAGNGVGGIFGLVQASRPRAGASPAKDTVTTGSISGFGNAPLFGPPSEEVPRRAAQAAAAPVLRGSAREPVAVERTRGGGLFERVATDAPRQVTYARRVAVAPAETRQPRGNGLLERGSISSAGFGEAPLFGDGPMVGAARRAAAAPYSTRRDARAGDEAQMGGPCMRTQQAGLLDRWFPCRPNYSRGGYSPRRPYVSRRAQPRREVRRDVRREVHKPRRQATRQTVREAPAYSPKRANRRRAVDQDTDQSQPFQTQDAYQGGPRYLAPVQGAAPSGGSGGGGVPAVPAPYGGGGQARPTPVPQPTPGGSGMPALPGSVGTSSGSGLDPSLPSRAYRGPGG